MSTNAILVITVIAIVVTGIVAMVIIGACATVAIDTTGVTAIPRAENTAVAGDHSIIMVGTMVDTDIIAVIGIVTEVVTGASAIAVTNTMVATTARGVNIAEAIAVNTIVIVVDVTGIQPTATIGVDATVRTIIHDTAVSGYAAENTVDVIDSRDQFSRSI